MTTVFLALGLLTMPLSQVFGSAADVAPVVPLLTGFVANTGVLLLLEHLAARYRTKKARC